VAREKILRSAQDDRKRCCDFDGAARFSGRAAWYARARPSYPDAAVSFVSGDATRIIDLGAGTGISTVLLGPHAIAVDPNLEMLSSCGARLRRALARAETLPFRTASADLLTAFNSFHWFHPEPFFAEAHRVLSRSGRLALIWNDWNLSDPFTRDFVTLMRSRAGDYPPEDREAEVAPLYQTPLFTNIERRDFPNTHRLDFEHLQMRLQSMTYIPAAGPQWDALARELRTLFEAYALDGFVTHRYVTAAFVASAR
jgi:SAM-dependent methyltransferase